MENNTVQVEPKIEIELAKEKINADKMNRQQDAATDLAKELERIKSVYNCEFMIYTETLGDCVLKSGLRFIAK